MTRFALHTLRLVTVVLATAFVLACDNGETTRRAGSP